MSFIRSLVMLYKPMVFPKIKPVDCPFFRDDPVSKRPFSKLRGVCLIGLILVWFENSVILLL